MRFSNDLPTDAQPEWERAIRWADTLGDWGPLETCVYRYFGYDGSLLYVGVTNDPDRRRREHIRSAPWWNEVCWVTQAWQSCRAVALERESHAIRHDRPRYNIAGRPLHVAAR